MVRRQAASSRSRSQRRPAASGGNANARGGRPSCESTVSAVDADDQDSHPQGNLLLRKQEIQARLKELSIDAGVEDDTPPSPSTKKPAIDPTSELAAEPHGSPTSPLRRTTRRAAASATQGCSENQKKSEDNAPTLHEAEKPPPAFAPVQYEQKSDTHWDYVLKEMMWLAADFQAERKRQVGLAKRRSASMKQFHKTKETRRLRELAEAEVRRRRLAARIAREFVTKAFWNKIERVITYKQKLEADAARRRAMDRHLVFLVKQTERYGESLSKLQQNESDVDVDEDENDHDARGEAKSLDEKSAHDYDNSTPRNGGANGSRSRRRRANIRRRGVTIEEALASAKASARQVKKMKIDYSRLKIDDNDPGPLSSYIASGHGDGSQNDDESESNSYVPGDETEEEEQDDETTLLQAEEEERQDRLLRGRSRSADEEEELRLLQEEGSMDMEKVLSRLHDESSHLDSTSLTGEVKPLVVGKTVSHSAHYDNVARLDDEMEDVSEERSRRRRRVSFASNGDSPGESLGSRRKKRARRTTPASVTVEELDTSMNDGDDEEFHDDGSGAVDDETTIEAEEKMGRDMSYEAEITLLKQENEMSVDELRAMYAGLYAESNDGSEDVDDGEGGAEETDQDGDDVDSISSMRKSLLDPVAVLDDDQGDDEEFLETGGAVDDETTIEAEERMGREMSHEEEIAMLTAENEVPIEELRRQVMEAQRRFEEGTVAGGDDDESDEQSQNEPSTKTPKRNGESDYKAPYKPKADDGNSVDENRAEVGETGIGEIGSRASESSARARSFKEELEIRKRECEVPIDDVLATYQRMEAARKAREAKEAVGIPLEDDDNAHDEGRTGNPAVAGVGRQVATGETSREAHRDDAGLPENGDAYERKTGQGMAIGVGALDGKNATETKGEKIGKKFGSNGANHIPVRRTLESTSKIEEGIDDSYDVAPSVDDSVAVPGTHAQDGAFLAKTVSTDDRDRDRGVKGWIKSIEAEAKEPRGDNESVYDDDHASHKPDGGAGPSMLTERNPDESVHVTSEADDALKSLRETDERARSTAVSRPFLISSWVKLREYQQVGLNWLVSLQTRRLNGILADEMGLGKTLQTISLLSYLASYKGVWGPHLIVVPTSCIVNWETELKRFSPGLKVLCYYGSAKRRKELRTGWTKSNIHHVIVTSYQLAVQDAFAFKRKRWYYLILDEAQNIKNFQSTRWQTLVNFNTQRRLLLTGTPLQNNLMELWSLLHFLMPHVFRSRKEFSYWFANPMNNIVEGNTSRNDDLIGRLHGIIRPFVLRRLKKDVEKQMPGKFEHIVQCQLSRRQMFLYEEFMARSSTRVALQKGGNYMGMMNVLMQLRKVCNHPDLFEPRPVVTPFHLESLSFHAPGSVVGLTDRAHPDKQISEFWTKPIWCGGCGVPSPGNALSRDELVADASRRIEISGESIRSRTPKTNDFSSEDAPVGIRKFLRGISLKAAESKKETLRLQAEVNSWRCQAPAFPYPERLTRDLKIEELAPDSVFNTIAETPSELLAMKRSQQQRADDLDDVIKKFVFCVPKARAGRPELLTTKFAPNVDGQLVQEVEETINRALAPCQRANSRLTSFFPDKKLVQFDAGKLQTLATLLRDLKRGGHRVLIFTQMSKMLDVFEAFLNLNGHTYLRLDGGTGVDRRQHLMDRFNNDAKIFCFILSTRSGGLGINLTGADTVIFYDSDWNPAMDAQAQDRAHRIGQTRDVHIYRLVTEHTVEENILIKAKQKRHLDFLVMDEGKFNSIPTGKASQDPSQGEDVFTPRGLREILGVPDKPDAIEPSIRETDEPPEASNMTKEQIENAMASLEDEDDVIAMRGAQKEVAEELREFDESIQYAKDDDGEVDGGDTDEENEGSTAPKGKGVETQNSKPPEKAEETANTDEEMEREFAAWQSKIGVDASSIEASLRPTERYALGFFEEIEPFVSEYAADGKEEAEAFEEEWDVEQIEAEKAAEEKRMMSEGELLASQPLPEMLPRQEQLYLREKARLRADKKRRKLTGDNWSKRIDALTKAAFFYNSDTGEGVWDKPLVLLDLEADALALRKRWNAIPLKPLVYLMEFLVPFPDRMKCSAVCRQWRLAATDVSFVKHVLPVEMGAMAVEDKNFEHNHFHTIADALKQCLPGDTIELGDGHYWVEDPGLFVDRPVRIVGDENEPSHVTVELSGSIVWRAPSGWIEGISLRRPRISSSSNSSNPRPVLDMQCGKLEMAHCVLNNEGSPADVAHLCGSSKGRWEDVEIRGGTSATYGVHVKDAACLDMVKCRLLNVGGEVALRSTAGTFVHMDRCEVQGRFEISVMEGPPVALDRKFAAVPQPTMSQDPAVVVSPVLSSPVPSGPSVKREEDHTMSESECTQKLDS